MQQPRTYRAAKAIEQEILVTNVTLALFVPIKIVLRSAADEPALQHLSIERIVATLPIVENNARDFEQGFIRVVPDP
jgi:hypothetical protein